MAISLRGTAHNFSASGNVTVTLPVGTAQNDVVYAFYNENSSTGGDFNMAMVTAGYTELADLFADDSTNSNFGVYRKVQGAVPDTTAVFDDVSAAGDQDSNAAVIVLIGVNTTTPEDATTTTATGTDTGTPNPASITTVTANAWVLALIGSTEAAVSPTAPTNYSNLVFEGTSGGLTAGATRTIAAPGAEDPGTFGGIGGSTADSWCAATVAVRPSTSKTIAADAGAHTFAGGAVTLRKGKILTAAAGAHTFAGTTVTLRHAWKVAVATGAHTFVGTSVALKHAWKAIAGSGAHTFAGTNVTLHKGYTIVAGTGAHSFAGADVAIKHGYRVTAGVGAHSFAGTDITIKRAWKLTVGSGSHTFLGSDVSLVKPGNFSILADTGAHSFAGTAVTLQHAWRLTAAAGAHSFTGTSITLKHAWKIGVEAGSHTFAGSDVTLTITAAPPIQVIGHRYAYDPRDEYDRRKRKDDEDRRKSLERAWALAHGLPDPYAEVIPEAIAPDLPPADLSALFEAMASAQAAIDRQNIEAFIAAQQQMAEDEAIAVLLLS